MVPFVHSNGRKTTFEWPKVVSEVSIPRFWGVLCIAKCFRFFVSGIGSDNKEFTDVSLAWEDGLSIEAHKAILTAWSPQTNTPIPWSKLEVPRFAPPIRKLSVPILGPRDNKGKTKKRGARQATSLPARKGAKCLFAPSAMKWNSYLILWKKLSLNLVIRQNSQ